MHYNAKDENYFYISNRDFNLNLVCWLCADFIVGPDEDTLTLARTLAMVASTVLVFLNVTISSMT